MRSKTQGEDLQSQLRCCYPFWCVNRRFAAGPLSCPLVFHRYHGHRVPTPLRRRHHQQKRSQRARMPLPGLRMKASFVSSLGQLAASTAHTDRAGHGKVWVLGVDASCWTHQCYSSERAEPVTEPPAPDCKLPRALHTIFARLLRLHREAVIPVLVFNGSRPFLQARAKMLDRQIFPASP
ncbi:hypothetical protein FA95DRAFT_1296614 [Auriscalpium vulgare]|uniref:Uncharacterized protein n=1 Tax=Auriscalpium vulgare TaxID=40419 RepID=A0ACB8RT52_9AGAM|nr:hypothetical protein FA95DRAFT_1296614 [Auriscalpium vulgare]